MLRPAARRRCLFTIRRRRHPLEPPKINSTTPTQALCHGDSSPVKMEKVKAINRTDLVSLSRLLSSAVVVSGGVEVVLEGLAAVGALARRVMIGGCRWLPSSLVAGADKAGGDRRRARWWFRDLAVYLKGIWAGLLVSSADCGVDSDAGGVVRDIFAPVAFIFSSFDNDV
ncbi:UDP-N-acetylglucosaminyltransferase [Striga asiatica]|uniref:UDP-N-acetylglucosaminyltransferase n=1 Tax=Striga asiatica TaxID=4170 RepID=A0A5A7PUB6_STRAF|nr:UDP-N-acetylglucosaminyltransferase [Striga asiatica]